ncbi:MAG TPA: twin-arginine translocase subunit TatC [Candidatus Nitrosopolaris sp.]|nr:twin-arginine translocase subunit TatC [Candidatus Nitrosopolaris sp.]
MYKQSPYSGYLKDLRIRVLRISITVGLGTTLCMTLSIDIFDLNGYKIPLLYPAPLNNLATQIIHTMKENLLPKNVNLIQVTPQGSFLTQIYVATLIGIALAVPITIREIIAFVGPALNQHEKAIIKKITIPAIGLFAIGCLFSYFFVIPNMLDFLYKYGESIGVIAFFNISEFIPFVVQFLIVFGFSYQFPLIMWATTLFNIVEPTFWRDNLRYMIIIFVVFGAVITPDGSGVTMWFVAGPMLLLYLLGMLFIEWKIKGHS